MRAPSQERITALERIAGIVEHRQLLPCEGMADAAREEVVMDLETLQRTAEERYREIDPGDQSDGYHTFHELYAHRCTLFCALLLLCVEKAWRTRRHADGSTWEGWFIAGLDLPTGVITYHLPESMWPLLEGVDVLPEAPEWDGHTSADVVMRLQQWITGQLRLTVLPRGIR